MQCYFSGRARRIGQIPALQKPLKLEQDPSAKTGEGNTTSQAADGPVLRGQRKASGVLLQIETTTISMRQD